MREVNETCPQCGLKTADVYMVTDECWAEAGLTFTYYQNVHLRCLIERLSRPIDREDFIAVPVNFDIRDMFEEMGIQPPPWLGSRLEREARWVEDA